ncbi:mitotic checkpoint serine/threonine-protein kinase BUB1 [Scomber japonicus]|uniref:mitotic checkpoint serine/threonine-protein kinase BUB1 n=1 Tax=Scomber japonicus TaxID=13676 RepID=UPI00230523B3|nr:mitotic checkpoint serine/threonine-protein kinase BUB1 [Scomber japonicus]
MSQVFDSLVQKYLDVERYANDVRYVNYCIKCASYYSEPIALYSYIFSKGVGTRTAALYVAWALQFEQRGLNDQADGVYQKALENQAQPAETVLHEYRQFQTRTKSQTAAATGTGRTPLQDSHLTNQMTSNREPAAQSKATVDCPSKPPSYSIVVSRSETSRALPSGQGSSVPTVSAYMTDELVCEGSELCFEEVRAQKYFFQLREKQEREKMEIAERKLREKEEGILSIKSKLMEIEQSLEACEDFRRQPSSQRLSVVETAIGPNPNLTQNPFGRPRPSNSLSSRRSLGLRLHTEPTFIQEPSAFPFPEPVQQLSRTMTTDPNALSSAVSHHPSVLGDRSVHLPTMDGASSVTQASMVQPPSVQPPSVQLGMSFEQMNLSLHRPAAVNPDVLSEDDHLHHSSLEDYQPQQPIITHQDVGHLAAEPEEKLDRVIMDMFQAPTLLEDPFNNTSVLQTAEEFNAGYPRNGGTSLFNKPPTTTPFTIFQDDFDKENGSSAAPAAAAAAEKPKAVKALAEIPVSKPDKPNDTPPDLMPDESTMWGARYNSLNSLAACPNSTTDFAMLAQFVSTPFTHKTPSSSNFFQDQENTCDNADGDDEAFITRQTKKLSPIIEHSPPDETGLSVLVPSAATQGTIVGEGLSAPQHCLTSSSITMVQPPPPAVLSFRDQTLCPTDSSITMAQPPPPAVLSFRDQTLCPTDSSIHRTTGPGWEVYTSPEQPPKQASLSAPESSVRPRSEPFTIMEDLDEPKSPERAPKPAFDVHMSPENAPKADWLFVRSPVATAEQDLDLDLDAFLSPCPFKKEDTVQIKFQDIPIRSPEQPRVCADVPMSPMQTHQFGTVDEPMMSPDRSMRIHADVSMNPTTPRTAGVPQVCDPWDNELISDLLSTLNPPLPSHPRCITWQCNIPNISPKMTISMGNASLRVDCVLGQGAFATVYQATDPTTSEKVVIKVQKPANPWEFYINTQLDARLQPDVRHLYSSIRSAHLFNNGSVLLGKLHNYGTLLNAVNIYKTLSDKVMPQPLVMYFTVCILHMVEQLHNIHVIHADIKPDNFMLGERFLENKCFDAENVDHGLALIDLGQSIDMELFPAGTTFTAKCLTSGFQCTEMLSGKPWSYQTDYFGIAGTVYCMLFGTYMQVMNEGGVWKTNAVFRRNPHSDLWLEFFHTLLNVPDCRSPLSLQSLRHKLTSTLQQEYSSKLPTLKNRLVVMLLENRKTTRR